MQKLHPLFQVPELKHAEPLNLHFDFLIIAFGSLHHVFNIAYCIILETTDSTLRSHIAEPALIKCVWQCGQINFGAILVQVDDVE